MDVGEDGCVGDFVETSEGIGVAEYDFGDEWAIDDAVSDGFGVDLLAEELVNSSVGVDKEFGA